MTVARSANGWTACFGTIKGDTGECWPRDTRSEAVSKAKQRIDSRLDIED